MIAKTKTVFRITTQGRKFAVEEWVVAGEGENMVKATHGWWTRRVAMPRPPEEIVMHKNIVGNMKFYCNPPKEYNLGPGTYWIIVDDTTPQENEFGPVSL